MPPRWLSATASSRGSAENEVGRTQFPDAVVVDLDGAFVAPAFVDSHVHVTSTGLRLTGLDLGAAESPEHCRQLLAAHVAAHPGQSGGDGWDDTHWGAPADHRRRRRRRRGPARLPGRVDVHSAAASSALRQSVPGLSAVGRRVRPQ